MHMFFELRIVICFKVMLFSAALCLFMSKKQSYDNNCNIELFSTIMKYFCTLGNTNLLK